MNHKIVKTLRGVKEMREYDLPYDYFKGVRYFHHTHHVYDENTLVPYVATDGIIANLSDNRLVTHGFVTEIINPANNSKPISQNASVNTVLSSWQSNRQSNRNEVVCFIPEQKTHRLKTFVFSSPEELKQYQSKLHLLKGMRNWFFVVDSQRLNAEFERVLKQENNENEDNDVNVQQHVQNFPHGMIIPVGYQPMQNFPHNADLNQTNTENDSDDDYSEDDHTDDDDDDLIQQNRHDLTSDMKIDDSQNEQNQGQATLAPNSLEQQNSFPLSVLSQVDPSKPIKATHSAFEKTLNHIKLHPESLIKIMYSRNEKYSRIAFLYNTDLDQHPKNRVLSVYNTGSNDDFLNASDYMEYLCQFAENIKDYSEQLSGNQSINIIYYKDFNQLQNQSNLQNVSIFPQRTTSDIYKQAAPENDVAKQNNLKH